MNSSASLGTPAESCAEDALTVDDCDVNPATLPAIPANEDMLDMLKPLGEFS